MSLLKNLKSQSLRKKLVIITLVITSLTLVITSTAFISLKYYLALQDAERKLTVLGGVISNRSAAALTFNDTNMLQADLNTLVNDSSITRGCFYDSNAIRVVEYKNANKHIDHCPYNLEDLQQENTNNVSGFFPVMLDKTKIGTLFIESSYLDLLDRLKTFLLFSILILIMALLLSYLLASWLQRMIINPIKDLSNTLRNIMMRKDYSIRADKNHNDELGDLSDLFNALLHTIEDENNSLKGSEARFRKLTELSPVGIFQIDEYQSLQYFNQRWCDIHGIESEKPHMEEWFNSIHQDDFISIKSHWQRLTTNLESISVELRLNRRDRANTWIQLLATPVHNKQGRLLGYLGTITDISELKAAQLQMETLAFYDPLTGLANRRLFRDRLEKAIITAQRNHSSVALMFLDMDQFKRVNDTLGHDAGDILLKEVARRLLSSVRETDTVSRIGGDEFTILLTDVTSTEDVLRVAEKILNTLARPIRIKGQDIISTASIGITLTPEDSTDANTLMKNADLAMYRSKELGRNTIQFFAEEMNRSILEHLKFEREISEALLNNQFHLVYQPKIDMKNFSITGVETLLRWNHPEKGFIPPDRFIPIAEETGQILDIGNWVLEQSCCQIGELIHTNALPRNARVAVNLSARQFNDSNLLQHIQNVLEKTNLPAHCLELELTESTLMDDVESAISTMKQIKQLGISIAIDDFGTGYSSLSYIKQFPIDVLKVDRSFVMDIPDDNNDMAITAAVIAMAHKLSLTVVAEGVESKAQLDFLCQNLCDQGQGYLFSRPLTLPQLQQFLSEHNPESFTHLV